MHTMSILRRAASNGIAEEFPSRHDYITTGVLEQIATSTVGIVEKVKDPLPVP